MRAVRKKLHIICIHDEWGLNHEQFTKIKDIIESNNPAFWEFSNPGTILIYYKNSSKGISKSSSLVSTLQTTKINNSELKNIGIGKSEGKMIFETNFWGKITSSPLGLASNEAIKTAKENNKTSITSHSLTVHSSRYL